MWACRLDYNTVEAWEKWKRKRCRVITKIFKEAREKLN